MFSTSNELRRFVLTRTGRIDVDRLRLYCPGFADAYESYHAALT